MAITKWSISERCVREAKRLSAACSADSPTTKARWLVGQCRALSLSSVQAGLLDFITLLSGAVAAWPFAARAQQPKKIPRLCFLTFDPGTLQSNRFDAFFHGLRDLGYANGQNIAIDYLSAEGNGERFPALAARNVCA